MTYRTDRNNNPTAFTTDVAREAGLVLGTDYVDGDPFPPPNERLVTARLLGDPIWLTIKVIDKLGFTTHTGAPRWTYINLPKKFWDAQNWNHQKRIIESMYDVEGGTEMEGLFK